MDATPSGIVNLYKPAGRSSAHYVYRLRPIFGVRKIGHAGTLDPFAEGVLLACVGKATKLVERLMDLPKVYRTTLRLGVTNETFDTERPFEPVPGATPPTREQVDAAVAAMTGEVLQVPPVYSAMRVGGVLSYRLAKQGRPAELAARLVRIYAITVNRFEYPRLELTIACGRGTYIRAIARDLGTTLGCGAACEQLERASVGPFKSSQGLQIETTTPDVLRRSLMPVEAVLELLDRTRGSDIPAS
ncbi:MAG: tRNA pseudouridine(55) synthase TruB [Planctomycetia bacterium]|jgi:tRNA pseudouridine55 synthase|nr:tRNA pseudouridine(55) synthase TruB [Planctomycetia bacterium]MCC7315756.1 tRNA pseudouridine(55) synthase TruB [Planctomycetota bacterium]OQZ05943.1 MAG: tRNA pseudouridine(55) synthase TruB [Planctomycetes bacterium UTPLA1]